MTSRVDDRGQATVEFALGLPVVGLVVLLVLQMAVLGRDRILVGHATREAARVAAVADGSLGDANDPLGAARAASAGLDGDRLHVDVAASGGRATVTVTYRATTDLPLIGPLLPAPVFTDRVVVSTEAPDPAP